MTYHRDIDEMPLPAPIALLIFHISREAVMNSLKHANASDFWISVHEDGDSIVLQLRDNGVGFDTSAPGPEGHFGMAMMRERAQVGGGTFDVESAPDEGATITVKFPSSLLQAEVPPQAVTGGAGAARGGRCFPRYIWIHAGGRRFAAKRPRMTITVNTMIPE